MIDFTVNVRPDTGNRGANSIELILPEGELMIITTRGEGFHPDADDGSDGDTHDQDKALYYAVERIAALEKERDDAVYECRRSKAAMISEQVVLKESLAKAERQQAGMAVQVELAQDCVANSFEFSEDPVFISAKEALAIHDAELINTLAKELIDAELESNREPHETDIPLEQVELVNMWNATQCAEWLCEKAKGLAL